MFRQFRCFFHPLSTQMSTVAAFDEQWSALPMMRGRLMSRGCGALRALTPSGVCARQRDLGGMGVSASWTAWLYVEVFQRLAGNRVRQPCTEPCQMISMT